MTRSTAGEGSAEAGPLTDVPISSFLDRDAREALKGWTELLENFRKEWPRDGDSADAILLQREYANEHFYRPLVERYRARYEVRSWPETVAGIYTEIFEPADSVSVANQRCVLLNLHGGGFTFGARYGGQIESIPVAAIGRIRVVSLDYRMAPEYQFPAATEDVVAVFKKLLDDYEAANIGIYGCSAGGVLTAQTVARLQSAGLPSPGAVGMFCGAAAFWTEGDTGFFRRLFAGATLEGSREHPYFKDTDPSDARAFPLRSPKVLSGFPPSLLVGATRDHALSSVVQTHSSLVQQNVDAELHVWEGLGHLFFYAPDLPQSREVYEVTGRFFAKHLGNDI